jgi:dihydroorotate dehydrogenase electron transfer subunit
MEQIILPIAAKQTLRPALWQLTLGPVGPETPLPALTPGQFLLARCADPFIAYLRRALFPIVVTTEAGSTGWQFLLPAADLADPGLAWLVSRKIGESVDLLGPLGRGFPPPQPARSILLIGHGAKIGPLLGVLQQAVEAGLNIVLALEAARAADLYPVQTLPPTVELRIATLDGSLGHRGSILDHLGDLALWADRLYACGPLDFYRHLAHHLQEKRMMLTQGFAHALWLGAPINVCGMGICTLCGLSTAEGFKLACQDGPAFDLRWLEATEER